LFLTSLGGKADSQCVARWLKATSLWDIEGAEVHLLLSRVAPGLQAAAVLLLPRGVQAIQS
jgi:hypothetical protein